MHDLTIIGAGPAGLSGAVNAASEGLKVRVVASEMGGQIARTSALENYIGYEMLNGRTFADRSIDKAREFGAEFIQNEVHRIWVNESRRFGRVFVVDANGHSYVSRSILLAVGMMPRKIEGLSNINKTIQYIPYAGSMRGKIAVIGAGNSAGQFAIDAANNGQRVYIVCRRDSLRYSMSQYLIDRILETPGIDVLYNSSADVVNLLDCECVAVFAGSVPALSSIDVQIEERNGYAKVSPIMQTSVDGIFAAGDILADWPKRVSVAVGTAAAAVANLHTYLAETA